MGSDRKKPGVAFWATVVLVAVLVGYPLSFGPWMAVRWRLPDSLALRIDRLYRPAVSLCYVRPDWLSYAYLDYLDLWCDGPWAKNLRMMHD